ncbi:MAG: hypothetical protein ACJAW3_000855 [Lentimonas sp.]|jgi:hypothetical protein
MHNSINFNPSSNSPPHIQCGTGRLPTLKFNDTPLIANNIAANRLVNPDQVTIFVVQNYYSPKHNSTTLEWRIGQSIIRIRALFVNSKIYFYFGECYGDNGRFFLILR